MPERSAEATVHTEFCSGLARLTLDNRARKNAITSAMAAKIRQFCATVEADDSIGAVIVDAVGEYFCSGSDTRAVAATSRVYVAVFSVGTLPVPTVAVVIGGAVGAGLNLALAADVVLVTPQAVLDSGFVARHIHPGGGHFALLSRHVNRQQAMAIGALGSTLTGAEAARIGAAWKAVAADAIDQQAQQRVARAAADPALSRRVKRSASLQLRSDTIAWQAAVELERGVQMWSLARKGEAGWFGVAPESPS
jgi:enoyl-CoA hydratase